MKNKNNLQQRAMNVLKKGTLAVAFLLLGNTAINAQSAFGVKAGLNLSKISNTHNAKNKLGMTIGAFAEFKMSDKFSIQPELLYSRQGVKSGSKKLKLNYINVPVLAKFYPISKISIEAGPQLGYLISKSGGALTKSDYKKMDLSAVVGVNYQISDHLGLGLRYNLGLKDITKTIGKHKNRSLQLSLAYKF